MSSGLKAALVVIAIAAIGAVVILSGSSGHGTGARGPKPGTRMPPFAAPLAVSDLVGDANISPEACNVTDRRALVSCRASAEGPLALAFVSVGDEPCTKLLPALEDLEKTIPGLRAAAVGIRGKRAPLVKLAANSPGVELAWDRDGALTNRYGIAVCPSVVIARQGGEVAKVLIGEALDDSATLSRQVRAALATGQRGPLGESEPATEDTDSARLP